MLSDKHTLRTFVFWISSVLILINRESSKSHWLPYFNYILLYCFPVMLEGSFLRHENSLGNRLILTKFLRMHRRRCSESTFFFFFYLSTCHYQWLRHREVYRPRFTDLRFQMTLWMWIFMSAYIVAVLSDFLVQGQIKELTKTKTVSIIKIINLF